MGSKSCRSGGIGAAGDAYERHHRNAAIWREFNGRNHAQLARKYRVGISVIYDVIAAERAKRQTNLFE